MKHKMKQVSELNYQSVCESYKICVLKSIPNN